MPELQIEGPSRSRARVFYVAAGGLLIGAVVGWSVATIFTPPTDVLSSSAFTTVDIVRGEVGSNLTLNTVAQWGQRPTGINKAAGVVTSVKVKSGQQVKQGSVLYTVNLRPTVVAKGSIPAFRDLAQGTKGADVSQLQVMLRDGGYSKKAPTGIFTAATASSVRAWQRHIGMEPDGITRVGDIIFLPDLPARVAPDPELLATGLVLAGDEAVIRTVSSSPSFSIPVTDAQANMMPIGTRIEITSPEGEPWEGFAIERITDSENALFMVLEGKDGASICKEKCGSVPLEGQSILLSRVVIVESVQGLTVPTAALLSDPDGTVSVIDRKGAKHAVRVLTSAKGMSVIEGASEGLTVRVPAETK